MTFCMQEWFSAKIKTEFAQKKSTAEALAKNYVYICNI